MASLQFELRFQEEDVDLKVHRGSGDLGAESMLRPALAAEGVGSLNRFRQVLPAQGAGGLCRRFRRYMYVYIHTRALHTDSVQCKPC